MIENNTSSTQTESAGLLNHVGGIVDRACLLVPPLAGTFRQSPGFRRGDYERELDFYIDGGYASNPASFFTFPGKKPDHAIIDREHFGEGERQVISYGSGYEPRNPLVRDRFVAFEANRTGYIIRWTHGTKGRKTVLCHHGFMLGEPRQAERMFHVRTLFELGLDVALFIAPFHWRRQPGPAKMRGIYMQPGDAPMTAECVGNAMYDLMSTYMILREEGAGDIGQIGASMGGYNTALFCCLKKVPVFAALMVPAINFDRPFGPGTARMPFEVDDNLRKKIDAVWQFHSPLNLMPKLDVKDMLVVAHRGDLICPFDYVRLLCERWGIQNRHFLTGGHWLVLDGGARGRAWYSFLAEKGFIGNHTGKK